MAGSFVRPMLNTINTSRYSTYADRTFCRGTLYESAVSQQVNFGIVAKISGAGEERKRRNPSQIAPYPSPPKPTKVQCVSYGWRITWDSLKTRQNSMSKNLVAYQCNQMTCYGVITYAITTTRLSSNEQKNYLRAFLHRHHSFGGLQLEPSRSNSAY